MDWIEILRGHVSDTVPILNLLSFTYNSFIFILIGLAIPVEFIMMIGSDFIEEAQNKKFREYFKGHSPGYFLKSVDMNKQFIIIEDTFFDNISEHGGREFKCNLNEAKERFIIENGYEHNVIIFVTSGCCSKKYNKIIKYCVYKNLPVCRIIDYKPGRLVRKVEILPDGEKIIYYKPDDK